MQAGKVQKTEELRGTVEEGVVKECTLRKGYWGINM